MSLSLSSFFWLSGAYLYLKYKVNLSPYTDIFFLMVIIIIMYFINMSIMQTKCNSSNTTVFSATLLPWLFIFGTMMLVLQYYPEWKYPFSNTFGFAVAKMMGLPDLMKEILVEPGNTNINSALESVRSDASLFINELYTEADEPMYVQENGKNNN